MFSISLTVLIACSDVDNSPSELDALPEEPTDIEEDTGILEDDTGRDTADLTEDDAEEECESVVYDSNPFASGIVSYSPGDEAGFGQDGLPDIVLGAPLGAGENSGSLDVLSLGQNGSIVLSFDMEIMDGVGPDIIVFENVFIGWAETGFVSASLDGEVWHAWPCEPSLAPDPLSGCAGVSPSLSHPDNCIDATDPVVAGGDSFDLADIGLNSAKFIKIQDSGANTSGGFDLDAVSIVHGQ